MKLLPTLLCMVLVGAAGVAEGGPTDSPAAPGAAAGVAALNALLDEQWQHALANAPEFATTLGDLRFNDRWNDRSPGHQAAEYRANSDFLRRFDAINTTGFPESDRLNQQLMVRQLRDAIEAHELKLDEMLLEQMSGAHLRLAGFVSSVPFNNTKQKVVQVEAYREQDFADAEYHEPAQDGSRPGMVFVNTRDFANQNMPRIEAGAYHEGVPGHHLQVSIAQELRHLPPFRQNAENDAYAEGWALYAERLGKDIGFYQDPLSDYGRLSEEMQRAVRLVLDTGVHAKHWTRQQMVDFFHAHSSDDEPTAQAETDRYITWAGQALGYKMGELKILALRQRARDALGPKFDLRAFHDQVLGGGALPLDVLEARIDAWIAAVKRGGPTPRTDDEGWAGK